MVSGHHAPAFTVASLATITDGRPSIRPTPVTTPAPGAWPSYLSNAIRQPDFEEQTARVNQFVNPFSRGEFAVAMLLLDFLRAAARAQLVFQVLKFERPAIAWLVDPLLL